MAAIVDESNDIDNTEDIDKLLDFLSNEELEELIPNLPFDDVTLETVNVSHHIEELTDEGIYSLITEELEDFIPNSPLGNVDFIPDVADVTHGAADDTHGATDVTHDAADDTHVETYEKLNEFLKSLSKQEFEELISNQPLNALDVANCFEVTGNE